MTDKEISTIHFQPGPRVYIYATDQILPLTDSIWQTIGSADAEVVGFGQDGTGIETRWYDGTNQEWRYCPDPEELQEMARKVRAQHLNDNALIDRAEEKQLKGRVKRSFPATEKHENGSNTQIENKGGERY